MRGQTELHVPRCHGILLETADDWLETQKEVLTWLCVSDQGPPDSAFVFAGSGPRVVSQRPSGHLSDLYKLRGGSSSVVQWGDSGDPAPCPTVHRSGLKMKGNAADETGY